MTIRYLIQTLNLDDSLSNNLKWNDGRRGQDGWDRYTRRRKWYRDAELVDIDKDGQNSSEETVTYFTQALEQETQAGEQGDSGKETDADGISLSSTTPLKNRRRRWFSGKEKERTGSDGSPDTGRSTGANADGTGSTRSASSRPISTQGSRQSHAREGSVATTDSASQREEQDHLDRWATRAVDGTERAEREFGLSDEVNMGLS